MNRIYSVLTGSIVLCVGLWAGAEPLLAQNVPDTCLQAATETVQNSGKYLHHSQLRRGMKGYGLTVIAGVEIVRFDAEVVSVLKNFSPQRDVVLMRLSGLNLENTGVIQGMSGSPVYIQDPQDGQYKLIGAVAYGWSFQKEPLAGIQPIAQMLAVDEAALRKAASQPTSQPTTLPVQTAGGFPLSREFLSRALSPEKKNFVSFARSQRPSEQPASNMPQLRPLATPLMLAGLGERTQSELEQAFNDANVRLVRAGAAGAGKAVLEECAGLKLQPGSSLSIPLVTGDADISATGTVTEVIDGRILGFGHPFFGNGSVCYPMATGYVHAVISNMSSSFKLASFVDMVGELTADDSTAVGGVVGRKVGMVPVTIEVSWEGQSQTQRYHYEVLRDQFFTDLLAWTVAMDSIWGTRNLPPEHTLEYSVDVNFGQLGRYSVRNLSANRDILDVLSDLGRPLSIMSRNPFGVARVESIAVKVGIREGGRVCRVVGATLDKNCYAPGDTVTARVQLWQWQGERFFRNIAIQLPDDLPDGEYSLAIGDSYVAAEAVRQQRPQEFDPRNLQQLLAAVQLAAETRTDRLYAALRVADASLSVEKTVMTGIPSTIGKTLRAACPLEVAGVERVVLAELPLESQVSGQEQLTIKVASSARP